MAPPDIELRESDTHASEETAGEKSDGPRNPFSAQFLDRTPLMSGARAVYLKAMVGGITALTIVIFVVFSIYWGSVWQTPHHALPGWIVDFDGGVAGQAISAALGAIQPGTTGVAWQVVSASRFQGGVADVAHSVLQEKTWYAVTINPGASANLSAAVSTVNSSYNSSLAVTFLGSEARNEYIYRIHSRIVAAQLEGITHQFALQFVRNISSSGNLSALASTAPELLLRPIYYTAQNMRPFDVPVASAITFVGLIYLLILSFFIVNISASARAASGLEANLTFGSLVRVRLASSFVAYFFIALFYTLLSRAFQLPFDRHFGRAGLVIFWMLNYIGMLACGLALEVMMTFLTARFVPFFLIVFIITNVSVSAFPIQVLPHIYRYGFAFPFYNISRAVRSIVFSTKNDLGMNFGILFAWVALSCITLPLTQWLARRRLIVEQARA